MYSRWGVLAGHPEAGLTWREQQLAAARAGGGGQVDGPCWARSGGCSGGACCSAPSAGSSRPGLRLSPRKLLRLSRLEPARARVSLLAWLLQESGPDPGPCPLLPSSPASRGREQPEQPGGSTGKALPPLWCAATCGHALSMRLHCHPCTTVLTHNKAAS